MARPVRSQRRPEGEDAGGPRPEEQAEKGVHEDGPLREKAHGSEVVGGGPKMHRRKAGGGGS